MPSDGTSTVYISMHTCKYFQSYRHLQDTNKYMYKHHKILSSVRQDILHGVSSKSHLGRHMQKHSKNIKENGK